jgi:ATP-binding cassette subfamily B protein
VLAAPYLARRPLVKSTLAAVHSGLHAPSSGLVLLRGLDRRTLGGAA